MPNQGCILVNNQYMNVDIPSIPTTPEEGACAALEIYFKWIDAVLAAGLIIPFDLAEGMRNLIRTQTEKIYTEVLDGIYEVEESLKSVCKALDSMFPASDPSDDMQWCKTLFACKAFTSLILNEKVRSTTMSLIPLVPDGERDAIATDYDTFIRYICKLSIKDILRGLAMAGLGQVISLIEPWVTIMRKTPRVDSILDEFFAQINGLGVFELLDIFLEFQHCVFTACDMNDKAKSQLQEVKDKLFITGSEPGDWSIDWSADWVVRAMTKETEVRRRLAVLEQLAKDSTTPGYDICATVKTLKGRPREQ